MKKRTIILFMALSSLSVTSKAQWTVIDPTNLAQSIVNSANEIVQTSTTAQNMWSNFQETVKIYKQGKAYYRWCSPYRRYNKYSIGKLLGKCPIFTYHHQLICPRKDGREYSTLESHKSISYQIATEW